MDVIRNPENTGLSADLIEEVREKIESSDSYISLLYGVSHQEVVLCHLQNHAS